MPATPTFDPSKEEDEDTPSSGKKDQETDLAPGEGDLEEDTTTQPDKKEEGEPKGRSAESRIKQLLGENKKLNDQLETERKRVPVPEGTPDQQPPEVVKAVTQLKKLGFVHTDELDTKVQALQDRIGLNTEHSRLISTYDGADGRPAYDSKVVEKYMEDNSVFQPEVAYKMMHETELDDWKLKQAPPQKSRVKPAPPGAPSRGETGAITRDKIAEMQAKGSKVFKPWYEKNREKIQSLMASGKL